MILFSQFLIGQDKLNLVTENETVIKSIPILYKSDIVYLSVTDLSEALNIEYNFIPALNKIRLSFRDRAINLTTKNPFVTIENNIDSTKQIIQMPVSVFVERGLIYISLKSIVHVLNTAFDISITINDKRNTLLVSFKDNKIGGQRILSRDNLYDVYGISLIETEDNFIIKLKSNKKLSAAISHFDGNSLVVKLPGTSIDTNYIEGKRHSKALSELSVSKNESHSELKIKLNIKYQGCEIFKAPGNNDLFIKLELYKDDNWFTKESENFKIIYRSSNDYLSDHILESAERSFNLLSKLFNYSPKEKIVIATFDIHDYGFGAATTVPLNFIRLEIEPFEPGYENVPLNERYQWILNHELVHILVNDHSSSVERFFRTLFSKVAPEQPQPLTILASLFTNSNRYTPRWHQESIAVFLETWLSGGYGRTLGNFDEMYFRSIAADDKNFGGYVEVESDLVQNNFLLETLYYLYGGRFATYLYIKFGYDKLFKWFITESSEFYPGYKSKFEDVFGESFDEEWHKFSEYEIAFQKENIKRIKSSGLTDSRRVGNENFGWVTQPYLDSKNSRILFGYHRPNSLATLGSINLHNGSQSELLSLPTPSLISVASTAYDAQNDLFFYTTNNNELYRDLWVLDLKSGDKKMIFENERIGHLCLTPSTKALWGIQHNGGKAILVYSDYPYNSIRQLIGFDIGDDVQQLTSNFSGTMIVATLHKSNGQQMLIVFDGEKLKQGDIFTYDVLTNSGSPENPSWSEDNKYIYWNAYTNGVSNIYRYSISENKTEPLSNTLKGYFRPIEISKDSIFVFEFSTDGFIPVVIANKPADHLPAIQYLGQQVIDKDPKVLDLVINSSGKIPVDISEAEEYNGFEHLDINTFLPVISGFISQKVLGFYTHIADPIINHDFTMELGVSPFKENSNDVMFHLKAKYDYKKRFELGINHNAPDFYDLVNKRKKGMLGTRVLFAHNHYWIYDNPLKIKQRTEVSVFTGVEYFIDNAIRVSEPDFLVAQTNLNSKNLRRSVGSVDYEEGSEFNLSFLFFVSDPKTYYATGQIFAEWDHYSVWLASHNVFHFKLASGYHQPNERLFQAKFFFGGFGNRELENIPVRQYRNLLRFPGVPIYTIFADNFGQLLLENNFPPIHPGDISFASQFIDNINLSVFSKTLLIDLEKPSKYIDAGAQINFVFKHWFNLESTFSAGVAKAWYKGGESDEWFLSFKLLKN